MMILIGILWAFIGITVGAYREAGGYERWAIRHRRKWPSLPAENYAHEYHMGRVFRLVVHAAAGPLCIIAIGLVEYADWVTRNAEGRLRSKASKES